VPKNNTMKYLHILIAVGLLAACSEKKREQQSSAETADSVKEAPKEKKIEPKGPKPAWAPEIDNQMLAVIEKLESYGAAPIESLTPQAARKNPTPADAVKDLIKENNIVVPAPAVDTVGKNIPVQGGNIHLRIYTPKTNKEHYPLVLYIHGGGWVIATIDTYDASAAAISEQAEAVVVSVEYRKGPEHKFPTSHNDSFAAYEWMVNNSSSIKGDTSKIALLGESAGGNMAINVAIAARDKKIRQPKSEVLVYPVAQTNMDAESYQKNENAKPLNKAMMLWFMKYELPSMGKAKDPRIDLTKANLKGLPKTTIIGAQYDPLMSDGQMLHDKLKEAGVNVSYELYNGVTHEFFGMAAVVPAAKDAQKYAVKKLF
jgi:acetyl esterase